MNKLRYYAYLRDGNEVVGAMLYKTTDTDIDRVADLILASIREPLYARYKPPYDDMVVVEGGRRVVRTPPRPEVERWY